MGRFTPSSLTALRGSYTPPRVRVGEELQCEIRGLSVVRDWHDAPIMWPLTWEPHKRRTLIVTGDLVKAMREETLAAVCANWRVGKSTVGRWKRALGIGTTPGTQAVRRTMLDAMAHDQYANQRRREAITPDRLANLHAHPRSYTDEQRAALGARVSESMLDLPICPVCQLRRTPEHIAHHRAHPDYICCRQCGNRWVALSQRPKRCKRCGRHDWDSYPCPVCGQITTDDHAVFHMADWWLRYQAERESGALVSAAALSAPSI